MEEHPLQSLIFDYLKQALSPEEQAQVEEELIRNPAFAEEVKETRELMQSLALFGSGGLDEQLTKIREKESVDQSPPIRSISRWKVAAAISLLLVIGIAVWGGWKRQGELQLLAQAPADQISAPLLAEKELGQGAAPWHPLNDSLLLGMETYEKAAYEKAADILLRYVSQSPGDQAAAFYLGICYVQLKEDEAARIWLRTVDSDPVYQSLSTQYLSALWWRSWPNR